MLERIVAVDKQLLVYLNSLGSEQFDWFWLFITKQSNWTPFFLLLLYFIYKKLGTKQTLILLLFVTVLLTVNNTVTDLVKAHFHRLRPCNDLILKDIIRNVKPSATLSFFSGHASNSMAVFVFLYLIFKKYFKYFGFVILWPLIFAYSRIYLGLHYPIDILTGYLFGASMGFLTFQGYKYVAPLEL